MNTIYKLFQSLTVSILLTLALVSCGKKQASTIFRLNYDSKGILVSSLIQENVQITAANATYKPGEILLRTSWSQGSPFNLQLPKINKELPPVGCVNTVIGQLLSYHRESIKPKGIFKGNILGKTEWVDFNTTINWNYIKEKPTQIDSPTNQDEIANLMKNLVIINKTSLDSRINGGSSTTLHNMILGLENFLGFNTGYEVISNESEKLTKEEVLKIVKSIDSKKPVILTTTGSLNHAILIDGYKIEEGKTLFHLNLGWGGLHNGFYSLNEPITIEEEFTDDAGDKWIRKLTSNNLSFYINLMPCQENCFNKNEASDKLIDDSISGSFHKIEDEDKFGPFSASDHFKIYFPRGSTPYFVSIINEFGEVITESNDTFEFESEESFYIRTSPFSTETNKYYPYLSDYKLNFTNFSPREKLNNSTNKVFLHKHLLNLQQENIIRLSSKTFLPNDLQVTLSNISIEDKFYKIENNLIILDQSKFNLNKIYNLIVTLQHDNKTYEQIIDVINLDPNLNLGSEQRLFGRFTNQSDVISFQSILKGDCTISGDRGFSNQAFYIDFNKLGPSEISQELESLELGIYKIDVSLGTAFESYIYSPDKSIFNLNIDCKNSDYSLVELESLL